MYTLAKLRNARISPQKIRLVADQIRGMHVEKAINLLAFSTKKGAQLLKKLVHSVVANAEHNQGADIDKLMIVKIVVDQGPVSKRMSPRAKGRGVRILKRTSHITIMVAEQAD